MIRRLGGLITAAMLLFVVASPLTVSADVNDFTVQSFDAAQTLTRNDPQGELRIVETIAVDFRDNNHGIVRALPKSYDGHSLQLRINNVSSPSGAPSEYDATSSNGNEVLKIGDPDKTVTGSQKYVIDYTVKNVITFKDGKQQLNWNINGDQWDQRFTSVSSTLRYPKALAIAGQPVCYTGSAGSLNRACTIQQDGQVVTAKTQSGLQVRQTLTYVVDFSGSYFTPQSTLENIWETARPIVAGVLPFSILAAGSYWYWRRYGRDARGKKVIIPQYDAPGSLTPIQSGVLIKFSLQNTFVTATIIDLAVRKYIRIIETKKDRLVLPDELSYAVELTNTDFSALNSYEKTLITKLFPEHSIGAQTDLGDKKLKLYEIVSDLQTDVKNNLITEGYLAQSRMFKFGRYKLLFIIALVVVTALCLLLSPVAVAMGLFAGVFAVIVCMCFIDARTAKGVEAKEHLEGLKLYLNVAEKDRIAALQSPDAPLARNAGEPVKTVELFEKLLSYAIVLGVEKQWGDQFKDIYAAPPDWYSGNTSAFSAAYLASNISTGVGASVSSGFTAPSSSSGGGAGGGGGGGGGGGW